MKFYLSDFPRFKQAYFTDHYRTWGDSLRNNGYPSTNELVEVEVGLYEMDDHEYTWFVLRWS